MQTALYILEVQRGHDETKHWNYVFIDLHLDYFWVTNMLHLSTDQQIDGFTFMGKSIKELRKTISNIGDRAKCTQLREQLENLEVRMIANK